jgi:hypothetical protein
MSAQAPVGTTLALLERQLKVMGAVQSRMHFSMKQEFKLLKTIIADYASDEYDYQPEEGSRSARKSDYDNVDVIPVSDPNASTMAQKVVQYQAALQLAQTAPQLYNLPILHRQMLEVLGIKNADKLVPIEDDMKPVDPVQENQDLLTSQPVKAFIQQNHQAHLAVHMAMIQNPKIQQMLQINPQGPTIIAAAMAHINEHIAFDYRIQMEQTMGVPLPPMDTDEHEAPDLPPEIADQVAMLSAQAAQQLLMRDQQAAAQQAAQQQMADPVVQMQMQELKLKEQDLQLKAQKQQIDAAEKADRLRIEQERINAQKEIAAMQVAATAAANKDKLARQTEIEGVKLGMDSAKHRAQMAMQRAQSQQRNQPKKEEK